MTRDAFRSPELVVFCGPMWSGKTSAVISYAERCKFQKKKLIAFKPEMDKRYSMTEISSHSGWKMPAHAVTTGDDIVRIMAEIDEIYDTIVVDEMFMIPGSAEILVWAFKSGINIIVATLDLSSTGVPFPEVKKLLSFATKIVKFAAVCSVCSADARYTYRKEGIAGAGEIWVGGDEAYEPRCWKCQPFMNPGDM